MKQNRNLHLISVESEKNVKQDITRDFNLNHTIKQRKNQTISNDFLKLVCTLC